ncbi:hypothetical protein BGZ73_002869 [Actinomortierella ambigua]|nr:hypothetical protein BGZ73_002869 [Actinomortierella ambigua]
MHFTALAILSVVLAAVQVSAKKPPTQLQIGVKWKNPDPNCVKVKDGDHLKIHYIGTLWEDGKKFDSSRDRSEPFGFILGRGEVIQGMERGMRGACLGDKRKLTIPSHLGYGEGGAPGFVPPNAHLVFDTELVGINDIRHEEL